MDAFVTRKRFRDKDAPKIPAVIRDSSISPPPKRKPPNLGKDQKPARETIDLTDTAIVESRRSSESCTASTPSGHAIPSPIQLNHVRDLPASNNVSTCKLSDVLGDPLIKECWLFNYLFDIDFLMTQFDPDTRNLIRIRIIHGSWRAEDRNGIGIIDGARQFPNIEVIKAYMAEAYGTHHSKLIVLFRQDDTAQIVILTGNFIERDWSMSQAIWRSRLLPLVREKSIQASPLLPPLGSGARFKHDLIAYFRGYGAERLRNLVQELQKYDFSEVRGALIASVPGKQNIQSMDPENETLWGWPGLKRILACIPSHLKDTSAPIPQPHIIAQVSSVAAVGEKWLTTTFLPALSTNPKPSSPNFLTSSSSPTPKTSIIFPTPDEIRRSVDGYSAGASIHMKTSTPTQRKQLDFLRPMLCHWAGDQGTGKPPASSFFASKSSTTTRREASRRRAAPHIKTYIRFHDAETMDSIDWAMVTSANLSTQAWGAAVAPGGEVRICSYEVGVVVWPGLWDENAEEGGGEAIMVPTFKRDTPPTDGGKVGGVGVGAVGEVEQGKRVVGWRMPYDLPLVSYGKDEMPWSAEVPCREPDWKGQVWPGYSK